MSAGVVIQDGTFATIVGVTVTSCFALMAYIVKTLSAIDSRVAVQGQRIEGLERRETARWGNTGFVKVRVLLGCAGALALLAMFWTGLYLKVDADQERRQNACEFRQGVWDGQISYTRYLADEFKITEAQEDAAVQRLVKRIGAWPEC